MATKYCEITDRDLKDAAEFRERIHKEALVRIQRINPSIKTVMDPYSLEDYFEDVWDYPGKWYLYVSVPPEAGSREKLINTIVKHTLYQQEGTGEK